MPDALDLLQTRRTISYAFLGEPGPSAEELAEILKVGVRVPDHGKLTPWRYIVFADGAGVAAGDLLADHLRKTEPDMEPVKIEEQGDRLRKTPVTVFVVSRAAPHVKIPEWEQFLSAGAVAMNVILAAHAMGFGAQWLTGKPAKDPSCAALFGVEPDERVIALIPIGTPNAPPVDRPRPDISDVTTWWSP